MSYEDLEKHNVFLPEDVWGKVDLSASVNQVLLSGVMLLGIVACVLMWWGHDRWPTWLGAGLFVAFMYLFTFVSNRGIDHQNEEIDRLIQKHR